MGPGGGVLPETAGTVNCLFTPSTSFCTATVTVWQAGPAVQFCPGQNALQSVNDIFLRFCPKKKYKEGKINSASHSEFPTAVATELTCGRSLWEVPWQPQDSVTAVSPSHP